MARTKFSSERNERKERVCFISTGCTLLNLALSQKGRNGGIARGRICNIVGDGSSGKTLIALEICAWYFYNIQKTKNSIFPTPNKIHIVYNNSEGVMDFPIGKMYGKRFDEAVEWTYINNAQKWGTDVQQRITQLKKGGSLLYIQDSLDALISQEAKTRIDKRIKGEKVESGTYGMEVQKFFSREFFNDLCERAKEKDVTLVMISQVRENLNAGSFGKKYRRNGGKALDFYTHQVLWLYEREKLKKTIKKNKKVYGVRTIGKVERNKVALPFRDAEFVIRFDYGIDDIQSMLNFLYGPKDKKVEWEGEEISKNDLIFEIEKDKNEIKRLTRKVEKEWLEIEEAIATTNRKKKYE